jgi:type VI secretion system protein ImpC
MAPPPRPVEEFNYEEAPYDADGKRAADGHEHYCWMNAAYVMGARMTDAFATVRLCVAIRGAEGGGKVESADPRLHLRRRRQRRQVPDRDRHHRPARGELSNLGLPAAVPLQEHRLRGVLRRADGAEAKKYDRPEATANAAISARLPYIMATSRFAHYLKVMARDKIGSFMEATDCEAWLNRWIRTTSTQRECRPGGARRSYPLREAKIEVKEVPGKPRLVQRGGLSAALAADGGTDDLHAHGRPHPAEGLTQRTGGEGPAA